MLHLLAGAGTKLRTLQKLSISQDVALSASTIFLKTTNKKQGEGIAAQDYREWITKSEWKQ